MSPRYPVNKECVALLKKNTMRTYTYSQIAHIALPILVSTLMEQLIGTTDTAFLGRVGDIELGASAIGGILFIVVFMLGLGFSIGAQILMARRNGEGNYQRIGVIFYHSIAFLLLLGVVLFVLVRAFSPHILQRIIQSPRVCEAATTYLHWRIIGMFFAFVNVMFRAFYVATTHTRTLTLNSVVMVLSNVCFNYVLIFGHFGVPALGIAGAAIGSSMAEGVSTIFFIIHTRRHIPCSKYGLHRMPRLRLSLLGKILNLSVWTMVQNFLSLSTWFIFFLSIEHLGEDYLAATNIIRSISSFTFMTVVAFASTAGTLVSNLMGQGEPDAVWPMLRRTMLMTAVALAPLLLIVAIFPDAVMSVFTTDMQLIDLGRGALYVLLASYVFTLPAQILFNAVSATGNTRMAFVIELCALAVYTTYVAVAIFNMRLSLPWCWASEFVYSIIVTALTFAYMRWYPWQNKKI